MIVLNDMPGQLCNRMWSYAPYVALSRRDRTRVFVPFFVDYAHCFPDLNSLPRVHFARARGPLYMRVMRRLLRTLRDLPAGLRKLLRIRIDDRNWGQEAWDPQVLRSRNALVFLSGWNHPPPVDDLRPYRDVLRQAFTPHVPARIEAEAAIAALRERAECVVGVHIRRGDYRTFLDGKYFFEWASYARAMRDVAAQLGRPTAFLLCSNEPIEREAFAGCDTAALASGDPLADLQGLSLCDYIVAAPSTFSLWASFCGQVPLHFVTGPDSRIELAAFSPAISIAQLADGTRYTLREEAEASYGPWNTAQ